MEKRKIEIHNYKGKLFYAVARPLIKYFEDFTIEDFQINEFSKATLIKRGGVKEFIEDANLSEKFVKNLMFTVCGMNNQKFTSYEQQVSAMLPMNKFRFSGCVGNTVGSGVEISIRLNDNYLYHSYKDFALSNLEYNYLIKYISQHQASIFIIGGTGTGKTSFTNVLIQNISTNEVIKVVGDIHDYIFTKKQKYSELFTKSEKEYKDKFDLLMRVNPDRILIPELSTSNVDLILRAIGSGHKGFMLTMHAGDNDLAVAEAFKRNLALNGKDSIILEEIQKTINSNIDFLIYLEKDTKGRRYVSKITINNQDYLEEAKNIGIFGYTHTHKLKSKQKIPGKIRANTSILKIAKDFNTGMSRRELAVKYKKSRNTINKTMQLIIDR